MKGQVLGFDGATGAITGDDGVRYAFALTAWKGDRPPQPRDQVDFVAADGMARDVYAVPSAFGATLGTLGASARDSLKAAGGSERAGSARIFAAERPQVLAAGGMIVASLLFNFAAGTMAGADGITAIDFPGKINAVANQLGAAADMMNGFGVPRAAPSGAGIKLAALFAYLLWLIPLGAAVAIVRDVTGKRTRVLERAVGALGVASIVIYIVVIKAIASAAGPMSGMIEGAVSFGFGGYLLIAFGIALLLTGSNRISRTPGM